MTSPLGPASACSRRAACLLDDGKITPAEMASHPQRNLVLRALVAQGTYEPDLQLRDAKPGDRYLLCSDGLHEVVDGQSIATVLRTVSDPDQAAKDLIALAVDGGAPDNVTCVVADVMPQQAPAHADHADMPR